VSAGPVGAAALTAPRPARQCASPAGGPARRRHSRLL